MCYVWGEMNHRREQPAMLLSRVAIAIPSLCAKAETNLRCAAAESAAAGEYRKKKNRADRIRTCDLFVPNEARYQPALQLAVLESRGNYTWKIGFGKYKIICYAKNSIKNTAWLLMPRGIQVISHRKQRGRETLFL